MAIKTYGTALLVVSVLFFSDSARAERDDVMSDEQDTTKIFEYGHSCEDLDQLSRVELVGITHKAYSEHYANFCKPDGIYRCDDYDSVFIGLGRLEDNGRQSCRYIPNTK